MPGESGGRAVILASLGAVGAYLAWRWWSWWDAQAWQAEAMRVSEAESEGVAIVKIANMRGLSPALLLDANVRAMLAVIRAGEGTADAGGYSRLFGGGVFSGWTDHPRKAVKRWGITSTAAGAYQFLSKVWDETRAVMGLPDFSPESQDLAAVGRMAARGALDLVRKGDFQAALSRLNREWASLPGSPYGQKTMTKEKAEAVYLAAGGVVVKKG